MAFKTVTEADRKQWAETKQTWPISVIFFVLAGSWPIVDNYFGRGWSVVTSALAAAIWFVMRPWRIGVLSAERRRRIGFTGGIMLCGWAIIIAVDYWRH